MNGSGRLVIVSNRLPVTIEAAEGGPRLRPSSGGLVSALLPIVRESRGCWVGWTGCDQDGVLFETVRDWESDQNCQFVPVSLSAAERDSYYLGFSNQIIWPLFHSLPSRCQFDPLYWNSYCAVNEKFADSVAGVSQDDDFIWVHDYHLMILAAALRRRGLSQRLAYFHHIPFPSPDIFETLPWRIEVLQALTQFDLLGFQTDRDRRNFIACIRQCLRGAGVCRVGDTFLRGEHRTVSIGTYPISIDYDAFESEASQPQTIATAQTIRKGAAGTKLILGVDRLDYTKGIPERLTAFQRLIENNPEWRGRVTMIQIVVPSREDIPEYEQLRFRIETLVSKINGEYSTTGWVPIRYFHRSVCRNELLAFYRAADIAVVTPLKDGMNLIAKEFCAARLDNRGVLVLSEFAGAAEELKCGALLVNPHDSERVALAFKNALEMHEAEQCMRMGKMRSHLQRHDVFQWFRSFNAGSSRGFIPSQMEPAKWAVSAAASH